MEFDPLSPEWFEDPTELYRRLRDEAPLYRNDELRFWALSRFDDVVAALRDWQSFSSATGGFDELDDGDASILTLDPPSHDRLRRMVNRAFTPRAAKAFEPIVDATVDRYLDALDGRAAFDAVADFAAPFPVEVISTILGVPDDRRQDVRHHLDAMMHREVGDPRMTEAGMAAAIALGTYFWELAEQRQLAPGDDMISQLCVASVEDDHEGAEPTALTTEEVAGFTTLLGGAGTETVTKLLGNAFVLLHRNPDQWKRVVADRALLAPAVEEVLRWAPPAQYLHRRATRDIDLEHGTIPAGDHVLLLIGSATRDERAYDDPDRFDIEREQRIAVGFGYGIHSCLGAALARLESRIALERFIERWPSYSVDESGLRRVTMENVAGYSSVPITVRA